MDEQVQQVKRVQEEEEGEGLVAKKRKTDLEQRTEDRRYPKKKVALLLAYSGKGYYGMQVQLVRVRLPALCCCSSVLKFLTLFYVAAESRIFRVQNHRGRLGGCAGPIWLHP